MCCERYTEHRKKYMVDGRRWFQKYLFIILFTMLYTIAIVLGILWLLGVVTSNVLGGFIHVLLVIAIIVVLVRVIRGEKVM